MNKNAKELAKQPKNPKRKTIIFSRVHKKEQSSIS